MNQSEIYCIYAVDEIAIITTVPAPVTEITQNHNGYDVPACHVSAWTSLSMPPDTYDCHLLMIGLCNYSY